VFRAISRRLAALNTLVVLLVIAAVGLASYLYLARKIEPQTDAELRSRSASAVELWTDAFREAAAVGTPAAPTPTTPAGRSGNGDDHEDDDDEDHSDANEHQAQELVRSGDTIAYGVDLHGEVIRSLRPIEIEDLPNDDAIDRALLGTVVVETMTIEHERVRVRTEPVRGDGQMIGAIQVGMGLGPNERMLAFVRWTTLGGVLLGALLAMPTGMLLANRSMRPIREAFARQRAFVADAAHELRTPLTLIRAEAEYLEQTPDLSTADRDESEAAIVREVDSMAALVSSLLRLARMDESGQRLVGQRVDLADVCRALVERFRGLALDHQVSLDLDVSEPAAARCDRAATEQVLAILLDNAITYTPAGGSVHVRTGVQSGKAQIVVADTGIGIADEDRQRIFDRFYRADPARSRSSGGAGLGLSIAAELMAAQKGRIAVESELGKGSTFTLLFESSPNRE
jgi:signal transduction histidine kinase